MRKTIITFLLFCCSFSIQAEPASKYTLNAGDEIRILVYDEPDLTVELIINDNGYINFPFVGAVSVTGKTTSQVRQLVHDGLKGDYLLNPSVQVDIITYRPFYIHGEVKKPGAYPYKPGLNVDQAVALAGGFTERASLSNIFIKSEHVSKDKEKGKKVSATFRVSPGDTITIEQSFF